MKAETFDKVSSVQVGTSAGELVKNDPRRVTLIISNMAADDVIITPDPLTPTSTLGILVAKSGGNKTFLASEDGPLPRRKFQALTTGAGAVNVTVIEVFKKAPKTESEA